MMQEDYVTFEQAKLLKEKGFPQGHIYEEIPCCKYWDYYGKNLVDNPKALISTKVSYYVTPTLLLVQKWLREEKNIAVDIHTYFSVETSKINHFEFTTTNSVRVFNGSYGSYEEALSAGINKALELL